MKVLSLRRIAVVERRLLIFDHQRPVPLVADPTVVLELSIFKQVGLCVEVPGGRCEDSCRQIQTFTADTGATRRDCLPGMSGRTRNPARRREAGRRHLP